MLLCKCNTSCMRLFQRAFFQAFCLSINHDSKSFVPPAMTCFACKYVIVLLDCLLRLLSNDGTDFDSKKSLHTLYQQRS